MAVELCDVNVLLYAFRAESARHADYRAWLEARLRAPEPFGVSELALSGFVRLVTNSRVFQPPAPISDAFRFTAAIRGGADTVILGPGPHHWATFERLCLVHGLQGADVADAYFAALAIEHGATWVTADRGFLRFDGLRARHPLGDW